MYRIVLLLHPLEVTLFNILVLVPINSLQRFPWSFFLIYFHTFPSLHSIHSLKLNQDPSGFGPGQFPVCGIQPKNREEAVQSSGHDTQPPHSTFHVIHESTSFWESRESACFSASQTTKNRTKSEKPTVFTCAANLGPDEDTTRPSVI